MLAVRPCSGLVRVVLVCGAALSAASCQPAFAEPGCPPAQTYEGAPPRAAPAASAFPARFADAAPMRSGQAAELEKVLDAAQSAFRPPAMTAAIIREAGDAWTATRTVAGDASPIFYWASAGKAWVAIAVLQLVEEGRLDLSDRLDRWAPDFPNAKLITVEQLLLHTSGLYSFQEDEGLRARAGFKSRDEVLGVARSHAPLFCPGRTWAYSNTGYVLLGLIVEQVDGRPLDAALRARIVEPLGLKETRILAPGAKLDGIVPPAPAAGPNSGTADDIRTPGAAGPVAASASDMARFWSAALRGELTSAKSVQEQYAVLYPMFGQAETSYGQGVMRFDLPATPNTPADVWLGHSGGLPGAKAVVAWSTKKRAVVAVALTGEGSPEAVANRLLAALD